MANDFIENICMALIGSPSNLYDIISVFPFHISFCQHEIACSLERLRSTKDCMIEQLDGWKWHYLERKKSPKMKRY